MSVFFNRVERGNPANPGAPKKWYAVLKRIGMVKEKEVARQIADETTLNRKEAEMALEQLQKILIRLLGEGNSVQLGDWGSFYLTCSSEGKARKEEVSAASIQQVNIRFAPGKELKEALQRLSFKDTGSMASGK